MYVSGQQSQQEFCNLLGYYDTNFILKHFMVATSKQDFMVKKCVKAGWNGSSWAGGAAARGWASEGYYEPETAMFEATSSV